MRCASVLFAAFGSMPVFGLKLSDAEAQANPSTSPQQKACKCIATAAAHTSLSLCGVHALDHARTCLALFCRAALHVCSGPSCPCSGIPVATLTSNPAMQVAAQQLVAQRLMQQQLMAQGGQMRPAAMLPAQMLALQQAQQAQMQQRLAAATAATPATGKKAGGRRRGRPSTAATAAAASAPAVQAFAAMPAMVANPYADPGGEA